MAGLIVVLDVGKTLSKATLWDRTGACIAQRTRPNGRPHQGSCLVLDVANIEHWLKGVLAEFAKLGPVAAVVPVAHGAGVALVRGGRLLHAPLDYEWSGVAEHRADYDRQRDPYLDTGSPALPAGLNLGMQLHWLESSLAADFRSCQILPWAQYWAWLLSGIPAAEFTSLGCHTDLWRPYERRPSELAARRGWADRLAPVTPAGRVLGTLLPQWATATGLSPQVQVYCGLHDSNAALLSARSHAQLQDRDATILSTGTWFVALRTPRSGGDSPPTQLSEARDCLLNVDVAGTPIPSSRFMGGREIEILAGPDASSEATGTDDDDRLAAAIKAVQTGDMILPPRVPGVGPYPGGKTRPFVAKPNSSDRMAGAHLYAALMADVSLDLIGSSDTVLIDGRFAASPVFVQALARLRPGCQILVSAHENGVAQGALILAGIARSDAGDLRRVRPLDVDLSAYRARWREAAELIA